MGIIPCRFTTLDMLRVESYLLFYPYDNSQKYPVRERGPRRHAVGARPRLHRQPRQDRLPRRGGALPAEGQGALQDLRRAAGRRRAGRRGRAGACRRQAGRRRDLRHVFAAGQEIDGHRPAVAVDCAIAGTPLEIRNAGGVDQGDGAAAALRRPEEDQAHAPRAEAYRSRGMAACRSSRSSAARSTARSRRSRGSAPSLRRRCRGRGRRSCDLAASGAGGLLRRGRHRLSSRAAPATTVHATALKALEAGAASTRARRSPRPCRG